jgi:glycosyltransferase involved in cell wall biosynthesis
VCLGVVIATRKSKVFGYPLPNSCNLPKNSFADTTTRALFERIRREIKMRIAQVAPLYESVPPKLYGGTERIVSYLTEQLVRQKQNVTLFASGDSVTNARLIPITERALRLEGSRIRDPLAHHIRLVERVLREADQFDILHFHLDHLHFPLARRSQSVCVTTLHGRLDIPDLAPLFQEFSEMPVVSISDSQREPLSWLNWCGTVYHGLPEDLYGFTEAPSDYLAFLGRICPEKGLDRAIEIVEKTGRKLKIAAKVDPADRDYFSQEIEPLLSLPFIEFVGEIGETEKGEFLGNAAALLFPIDWPEPFGLVMIEAMACGTPVIAFNSGSVPEIIENGVTGFVVSNIEDAASAVESISTINRRKCRETFEQRFSASRMASDYLDIYRWLVSRREGDGAGMTVFRPAA